MNDNNDDSINPESETTALNEKIDTLKEEIETLKTKIEELTAVSYTHLTLPTILLV